MGVQRWGGRAKGSVEGGGGAGDVNAVWPTHLVEQFGGGMNHMRPSANG